MFCFMRASVFVKLILPGACIAQVLFLLIDKLINKLIEYNCRREDFLRIPELAINPLGDRIVHAFFTEG